MIEKDKVGRLDQSAEAGQTQDWIMVKNWCQKHVINQAIKDCLKEFISDQIETFLKETTSTPTTLAQITGDVV